MQNGPVRTKHAFLAICAVVALTACAPRDDALQGQREALGLDTTPEAPIASEAQAQATSEQTLTSVPISLPAQTTLSDWTHPGSDAQHSAPHLAFAATPALAWSANIGAGDGRRQRINAAPVAAGGRIFTVDANGVVAATSAAGERLWTKNLTPPLERVGQGGSHGLAFGGGALYANTGFGEVVALDPATGAELWTQDLDAQGGSSATYFDGRVYVAARDSVGWAIDAESGRIDWQLTGTPSASGYVGGAGPAVTEELAIFPFASGELRAVFRRGGISRWGATVLGGREGAAYARISDISAAPVVDRDRIYVANPAGRLVALGLGNGERIWTAREGALTAPIVAGGSLFLVTDQNALIRVNAATGETIWSRQLSLFEERRERRQKTLFAHRGPVLAGGRLWVASSEGNLRAYSPTSGAQLLSLDIPGGAASAPIVVGGVMYVVSKRGRLLAFR